MTLLPLTHPPGQAVSGAATAFVAPRPKRPTRTCRTGLDDGQRHCPTYRARGSGPAQTFLDTERLKLKGLRMGDKYNLEPPRSQRGTPVRRHVLSCWKRCADLTGVRIGLLPSSPKQTEV